MNVDELNYVDLKLELEKRRMDSSGVQSVLAERLRKAIELEGEQNLYQSSKNVNNGENKEKSQAVASGCHNLWVSGLVSSIKAQDLNMIFSKHGKVLYAKIFAKAEEIGKCFGFVAMATSEDAEKCINHLDKTEVNGQIIQIAKVMSEPGVPKVSANTNNPTDPKALMVAKPYGYAAPNKDSPPKFQDQQPRRGRKLKNIIVAGNSIAGHFGRRTLVAARHGINMDLQCWPDANLSTILNNLRSYINRTHNVILIFGLTFEAWNYMPLLDNKAYPRILFPNPNFNPHSVMQQMESFVQFCLSVNPVMKVLLVVPPVQDIFVYNVSRVKEYAPEYVEKLARSPTLNIKSMANYSRDVFKKLSLILRPKFKWPQKFILSSQNVINSIPNEPMKRGFKLKVRFFLKGRSDSLDVPQALVDGLHPSLLFIKHFWIKFSGLCCPLKQPYFPPLPRMLPDVAPPHLSHPDRMAMNRGMNYNVQKEHQNLIEYNHLMRGGQVLHPEQVSLLNEEEMRKEEAAEKLLRERVSMRLEKQKLEREKEEFLRLEQEHLRIEREREEIRILQLKYQQLCAAQGIKRPSSSERETLDYHQNNKRAAPDRNTLNWPSERPSYRSGSSSDRIQHFRSTDSQPSFRESRISRDSQYNGDSESSGMVMDSWRLGTLSRRSNNSDLDEYETASSRLVESEGYQTSWYPSGQGSSINMSYNLGNNNSSMLNQSSNSKSSIPDQTRNAMNAMGVSASLSPWGWSRSHRLEQTTQEESLWHHG